MAAALIDSFGGLHAAADSMGLSKRLLTEEAEARKVAKREAAQQQAAEREEQRRIALEQAPGAEEADGAEGAEAAAGDADDDDLPPGVALPGAAAAESASGAAPAEVAAPTVETARVPPPPPPRAHFDPRWQYDPNTGLYFQTASQTYFDAGRSMYHKDGRWSRERPA